MEIKDKKIVPDTSILIHKRLSALIEKGKLKDVKVIVPKAVIDELQAQASRGREIGIEGLEEIKKIRSIGQKQGITIEFFGKRPTMEEIQLARKGRIDAIIRDVAAKMDATLITADFIQALVGEAEGIKVSYIRAPVKTKKFLLERYFDPFTQSVHLKVGVRPLAKKGKPGSVRLVEISSKKMDEREINKIIDQIMTFSRADNNSFVEIGMQGALVVQRGDYRISITRPPFSDGLELTAVRPIAKVNINQYMLHEELRRRFMDRSPGILIAGPPGSGKSSFASAIANYLVDHGKIVKTFEQPRDLQVGPAVTQYAPLEGDWEKTADLLLLVRPDFTIFDEIRKTREFRVFGDMRLAGVGMIGVIHATNPVSAIQRFIGRVELGIIPHIIDTVVFIEDGQIRKVFELSLLVKVPTGMQEADLARPVVEIRDFASKNLEYEIYTYGEENVIIPVKEEKASAIKELARKKVIEELKRYDPQAQVEIINSNRVIARVRNDSIARLIGKKGQNIEKMEKELGVRISVEPKEGTLKQEIKWGFSESGAFINLKVPPEFAGKQVDVYQEDSYIFSPYVGKGGFIKIRKRGELGSRVMSAVASRMLVVMI